MKRILLVNPPIYDFSAYDFWLKPYGLLRVGGFSRGKASIALFDFLDPSSLESSDTVGWKRDQWGRGKFPFSTIDKPVSFTGMKSRYRRYGLNRDLFRDFLESNCPFDFALIQTTMTYWYPGVQEVLEDLNSISPKTKTILGGNYATSCHNHAQGLGADRVIYGDHFGDLWKELDLFPDYHQPPFWEGYQKGNPEVGVMRLSDGCPFRCTYCSVPVVSPRFRGRPLMDALEELRLLKKLKIKNIAFYDDALLFKPEKILEPFLDAVQKSEFANIGFHFHTPNALNARHLNAEIAGKMVNAGFKTFFLGFESSADNWQKTTGGKVYTHEFERAVKNLLETGIRPNQVTCYLIVGHPFGELQQVEESMRFASSLGVRVMLSEFSPIPGTPDGEFCRKWIDLDEPLNHNKTFFTRMILGEEKTQELKDLSNDLNRSLNQN